MTDQLNDDICNEYGIPAPEYIVHKNDIMIMFTVKKQEVEKLPNKLPNKLDMVYRAICENNYISNQELSKLINVSERMIRSYIATLKKDGYIKRVGSRKQGYWDII